jgi:mannose-6-phosphate isomerase
MSNMPLYPFKFKPRLIEKMWGGRKIETILGKTLPPGMMIGESWELYDFPPGVVDSSDQWISSEIANGPLVGQTLHAVISEFDSELHGDVPLLAPHGQFPILIKYLDAQQDLSVQVHPDERYARAHPEAHLKSEAWYVIQSDPNARLLKGLRPGVTRETFRDALETGTVDQLINSVPAKAGQCYYLPSGAIHALGAGILVAEIQTPSDTTFRVFDFNRIDPATGNPRALHIEQALECIDFSGRPEPRQQRTHVAGFFTTVSRLITSEHFKIEKVRMSEGVEEPVPYDEPVVWIILEGQAQLKVDDIKAPTSFGKGETLLLPARMNNPIIKTIADCQWLEITFPAFPEKH